MASLAEASQGTRSATGLPRIQVASFVNPKLVPGWADAAAVVAGIRRGLLGPRVDVVTRGGLLTIEWQGGNVQMTGPAESVFTGEIDLDAALAASPLLETPT